MEAARVATSHDIDRIVALTHDLREELQPMKGGVLWSQREARPEPLDVAYQELIDRDDALVVVGTIDHAVIGYGIVILEELRNGSRLGIVTDLFVEPEARGVSVGETMKDVLVGFCDERGCIGIDALALPGHRAAKNFFETAGFTARAIVMHRRSPR